MENIGAVKELSKITTHLEARISELEQDHKRCLLLADKHPGIALSDLTSEYRSIHHELKLPWCIIFKTEMSILETGWLRNSSLSNLQVGSFLKFVEHTPHRVACPKQIVNFVFICLR